MRIVALTGQKFSGKDYLAASLIDRGYVRVSFSDQLKKMANAMFPWIAEDYPSQEKEVTIPAAENKLGVAPRDAWKAMDVLRREVDPRIFVRGAIKEVCELIANGNDVVITDIRKDVEHEFCKGIGATIIRIECDRSGIEDDPEENIINGFDVDFQYFNEKVGLEHFDEWLNERGII